MSLFGDSQQQELTERERTSGLTVRKEFTKTVQAKGGDSRTQARATEKLTEGVLGCSTDELYKQTGATKNKRETLPVRAQEALMVGEIHATHDLKQAPIEGNTQQKQEQIVDVVETSAKETRKRFPW